MNLKHLFGSFFHLGLAIIATIFVTPSCQQRSEQNGMDESAFVFETTNIKGNEAEYSRPAVITGQSQTGRHIRKRRKSAS